MANAAVQPATTAERLTISTGTAGATIRYTVNGGSPTVSATNRVDMSLAAAPFGLGENIVRAIALKPEFSDSEPASATLVLSLPPVAAPTFRIGDRYVTGGVARTNQSLIISAATGSDHPLYRKRGQPDCLSY